MAKPNPKNRRAFLYTAFTVIAAIVLRQIGWRVEYPLD